MSCCGVPKGRKCGCCDESYQMMAAEQAKRNAPNPCIGICPPTYARRTQQQRPATRLKPRGNVQCTLDGKVVPSRVEYQQEQRFPEYPPPPWVKPRLNSRELRGGVHYTGCDCYKKNGLQDDCQRWECGSRFYCTTKPDPMCDNSRFSPTMGVHIPYRNPNEYY